MSASLFFRLSIAACCFLALSRCDKKPSEHASFTKADSVTETYLALQDTMLQSWNTMIHDDNRKITAMEHLLTELMRLNPEKQEELKILQERLDDLKLMRYDQKSMSDSEIVTEYDFVSNSLVSELLTLAESQKEFAYNNNLQKLTDTIRSADQRVMNYREAYDATVSQFNTFIESNHDFLDDITEDSFLEKKPLFQMTAD